MKIRVAREGGGLGDVVRMLPAITGLRQAHADAQIDAYVPRYYSALVRQAGVADRVFSTPMGRNRKRRPRLAPMDPDKYPYLAAGGDDYDETVDLFCPAYKFEAKHPGNLWEDRIELFCRAAGVNPATMTPRIPIAGKQRAEARALLAARKVPEKAGWIALQPFSTDPGRDWPREKWAELADALALAGYGVFCLDSVSRRTKVMPVPSLLKLPLLQVAAILSVCRCVIGPDSGLPHLAGAVGTPAIGLTAAQSGAVLYRHYPRHWYIQPDLAATARGCRWPCYWDRLAKCRSIRRMRAKKRTCPTLAGLASETVYDGVRAILALPKRPPEPKWPGCTEKVCRKLAAALPRGESVVDVCGKLGRLSRVHKVRVDARLEAAWSIPLPLHDRTALHAVCWLLPHRDTAREWLWELFRVLDVGGVLYGPPALNPWAERMGFRRDLDRPGCWARWRKETTWPCPIVSGSDL